MIILVIELFALILLADFITVGFHWWEDTYGNPEWKYMGKLTVVPNIEHHQFPRKFLTGNLLSYSHMVLLQTNAILFRTEPTRKMVLLLGLYKKLD